MIEQQNPWWSFMWAANKELGPDSDGHALAAVRGGICALRQFPASEARVARDPAADYAGVCVDRLDAMLSAEPLSPAERCTDDFLFWFNPYQLASCMSEPWHLSKPADYLLPYWMGRYYGFISEG